MTNQELFNCEDDVEHISRADLDTNLEFLRAAELDHLTLAPSQGSGAATDGLSGLMIAIQALQRT